jgi:endonuclease/exonuclease/phosphatase family metal-dependent hydrolase
MNNPPPLMVVSWNVHHFSFLPPGQSPQRLSQTAPVIKKALRDHNVDIACFQEVGKAELLSTFGLEDPSRGLYSPSPGPCLGNGLFIANKDIVVLHSESHHLDVDRTLLMALIEFHGRQAWIGVTHLDHQSETRRLRQAKKMMEALPKDPIPLLLAGDFNSLDRADYTAEEWQEMDQMRLARGWELCASEVIPYLKGAAGLRDLGNPLRGSRFGTRIDYFFGNALVNVLEWGEYQNIPGCSDLSDHENICLWMQL